MSTPKAHCKPSATALLKELHGTGTNGSSSYVHACFMSRTLLHQAPPSACHDVCEGQLSRPVT